MNKLATEHAKCDSEKRALGREKDLALNELKTLADEHAKCEPEKRQLQREKVVHIRSCIGVCVLWGHSFDDTRSNDLLKG